MIANKKYRYPVFAVLFLGALWAAWFLGRVGAKTSLPAGNLTDNGVPAPSQTASPPAAKDALTRADLVPREAKYWKILVE